MWRRFNQMGNKKTLIQRCCHVFHDAGSIEVSGLAEFAFLLGCGGGWRFLAVGDVILRNLKTTEETRRWQTSTAAFYVSTDRHHPTLWNQSDQCWLICEPRVPTHFHFKIHPEYNIDMFYRKLYYMSCGDTFDLNTFSRLVAHTYTYCILVMKI